MLTCPTPLLSPPAVQLNEDSPSTLWYSSTGADEQSLTGLGAGKVPAHYHHMYYNGPAPHQHHASSYDEVYGRTSASPSAAFSSPHFDEAEIDPRAARHHAEGHQPPQYPPPSYHHHADGGVHAGAGGGEDEGWVHEVPHWMEKQGREGWEEAERMMAGNTAVQKLRRQQKRKAQEEAMKRHIGKEAGGAAEEGGAEDGGRRGDL